MSRRQKPQIDPHDLFKSLDKSRVHRIQLCDLDDETLNTFPGSASRSSILDWAAERRLAPGEYVVITLGPNNTKIAGPSRFIIPVREDGGGVRVSGGAAEAPAEDTNTAAFALAEKSLDDRAEALARLETELRERAAALEAREAATTGRAQEAERTMFEVVMGTAAKRGQDADEERRRITEHYEARLRDKDAHHQKVVQEVERREEEKRAALESRHSDALARQKSEHEADMARRDGNHEAALARVEADAEIKVSRAEAERDREQEKRQEAESKLSAAHTEHQTQLAKVSSAHEAAINALKSAATERETAMEQRHRDALASQEAHLRREFDFERKKWNLERDGDKNIPAAIRKEWHLRRLDREMPEPGFLDQLDRNLPVLAPFMMFAAGMFKEGDPRRDWMVKAAETATAMAMVGAGGGDSPAAGAPALPPAPGAAAYDDDDEIDMD